MPKKQSIKNQIRSVKRFLSKAETSGDTERIVHLKHKLHGLNSEHQRRQVVEKEKKYARKYHKVKFFERKKVLRRRKQVQAKINAAVVGNATKDVGALKKKLSELDDQLDYIQYFPKQQKYISLFAKDDKNSSTTAQKREKLMKLAKSRKKLEEAKIVKKKETAGKMDYDDDETNDATPTSAPGVPEDEFFL